MGSAEERDDDLEQKQIVARSVDQSYEELPAQRKPTWPARLGLIIIIVFVVVSSVGTLYNTFVERTQIACNHQLLQTIAVLGDQNRANTKRVIDIALSGTDPKTGQILTRADLIRIKNNYDKAYAHNIDKRNNLLANTCASKTNIHPPAPIPSPVTSPS